MKDDAIALALHTIETAILKADHELSKNEETAWTHKLFNEAIKQARFLGAKARKN